MKNNKLKLSLLFFFSVITFPVWAVDLNRSFIVEQGVVIENGKKSPAPAEGDRGGNGIDGHKTEDQKTILDLIQLPSTKMFQPREDKKGWDLMLVKFSEFNFQSISHIGNESEGIENLNVKLIRTAQSLKWFVVEDLPEVTDKDVVVINKNVQGRTVRLAIQKDNIILINALSFAALDTEVDSRSALYTHVILSKQYLIDTESSLKSTTKIANLVNEMYGYSITSQEKMKLNDKMAYDMLSDMGIRVAPGVVSIP